jgi:signal transduction histidine kinase
MQKSLDPNRAAALALAGATLCIASGPLWIRLIGSAGILIGINALWERNRVAARELRSSADMCAASARSREETLALVAHDLRNPLNLIMTTAQLFAELDPPPDNRRRLTDAMQRAARSMNRLIEDLLDVARIDSGRLTIDPQDISALALVRQTIEMFEQPAREKGVILVAHDMDPDLVVRADPERIVQALGNLVGNAVKFVPAGGTIRVACCRRRCEALIMVRDSGPGIPSDELDFLFAKFWQGRSNDRRGIGLGLTITRGIVEAHGGTIWVESVIGRGASFCFTLPTAKRTTTRRLRRFRASNGATSERANAPT